MTFRWRRTRPTRHGITARRRIGIELLLSPSGAGRRARFVLKEAAREAGLGFESAEHLRAEQICAELPGRAAAVQCFASLAVAMLTEHHDGIQALACAMAGEVDTDLEPTVRRWSLWQGSSSVESVT